MSNEITSPVAAEKSSKWADNEKIALLVSMIRSSGATVKWPTVPIPAGRTTGSSQKQYEAIVKSCAGVPMAGGDTIVASTKRKAIDEDGSPTKSAKKPRTPRKSKAAKKNAAADAGNSALVDNDDEDDHVKEEIHVKAEAECDEEDIAGTKEEEI